MARKKTYQTVDTGIFSERQIISPPTKRELAAISKWYRQHATLDGQIIDCEKSALSVLKKYGIGKWPTAATVEYTDKELTTATMQFLEACQRDASDELRDAGLIMSLAHKVRRCVALGDAAEAAKYGLQLGVVGVRLAVRPHEKPAATGRKVRAGAAKGRTSDARAMTDAAMIHEAWRRYADTVRAEHERRGHKLSQRNLARMVRDHFNKQIVDDEPRIKFETVRKALQKNLQNNG